MAAAPSADTATTAMPADADTAILAGGCFWCIEAVFNGLKGVHSAVSGYTAGHKSHPTYDEVCSGRTGHTEAVRITYDPAIVSYRKLLDVFFTVHDPTTLNRQGHDVGTQYRSGIYYLTPEQQEAAAETIKELQPHYKSPIVTEVLPASTFYEAEAYHQRYFEKNPGNGYCAAVVAPKVSKARTKYSDMLK